MNNREIKALVSLLEDEDSEVLAHVEEKIVSMGEVVIPFLEVEWENNYSANVQRRIEDLLHTLQVANLHQNLKQWKESETEDLLRGVALVASFQYPELDTNKIVKEIEKIYYEVWLNHRPNASPFDQVKNINQVFFNKLGFHGNTQNFHSPNNSMINIALETRRGSPIMLCVIYMLVTRRMKLPIYGVNLPNLFILTYKTADTQFYINVFNHGLIFSRADIDDYIHKLNLPTMNTFYEPCTHLEIVQRLLRNLINAFDKLNETEKVKELTALLKAVS